MSETATTPRRRKTYDDLRAEGRAAAQAEADAREEGRRQAAAENPPPPTAPSSGASGPSLAPVRRYADKNQARKVVLISMMVLFAINIYRSRQPENDVNLYKRTWGVGVLGFFLCLGADLVPQVAGPFAVLTVLGSLTHGGDTAIQNALSGLSSKLPAGTGTVGPQGTSTGPSTSGSSGPAGPAGPTTGTAPTTTLPGGQTTRTGPAGPTGPANG